jgi:hypothetical protein
MAYESAYGDPNDVWGNLGNALQNFAPGALQGAGTGATIGSLFGPVGTAVGGGLGALIGGVGSLVTGNQEIEARRQQEQMQQEYLQNQQAMQDAAFAQQRRALNQMYGGQQSAIAQQYAQQTPGLRAALAARGMLGSGAESVAMGGLAGQRAQSLAQAQQANILGQSNIATNQTAAQMQNQALAAQMQMANQANASKMYSDRLKSTMSAAGGLASSLAAPGVSDVIKSAFKAPTPDSAEALAAANTWRPGMVYQDGMTTDVKGIPQTPLPLSYSSYSPTPMTTSDTLLEKNRSVKNINLDLPESASPINPNKNFYAEMFPSSKYQREEPRKFSDIRKFKMPSDDFRNFDLEFTDYGKTGGLSYYGQ